MSSSKRLVRKSIIRDAHDLRVSITCFAAEASPEELATLGDELASLRTDLMELTDGSYDAADKGLLDDQH